MASEIRVDKINSLSGVGTVTLSPTGVDVAGGISTFHNDLKVSGIATVGSLSVDTGFIKIVDSIIHTGDPNTKIRFPAADTFTVETVGTERVRIDSNGRLGIGTATANAKLHILHSESSDEPGILLEDGSTSSGAPYLEIIGKRSDSNIHQSFSGQVYLSRNRTAQKVSSGLKLGTILFGGNHTDGSKSNIAYPASIAGVSGGDFNSVSDMPTDLVFYTGSTGRSPGANNVSSGDERLRIKSDGDVTIADGDLIIGTAGHGIDFSAQTASSVSGATPGSEVLDHYEEGVWTPVLSFGGGTTGITYDNRDGEYTRIGRQVTIHFMLNLSDKGSSTGYATVTGLPFAVADLIGNTVGEANGAASYWNNFTPHMMWVGLSAETSTSNLSLRFQPETGASDAVGAMTNSNFTDSTTFRGTVTYFTS